VTIQEGQDIEILVTRARAGSRKALEGIVLGIQDRIYNLALRMLGHPADAEDATQEIMIKIITHLGGFRGDSAFYTWLYRVAINTAKNHLAAQARRPPGDDIEADTAEQMDMGARLKDTGTPERMAMQHEIAQTIQQALDELPDDLRTAITLRELEGLSYEEIAQAMDCPIGTVRSRIFRAREAIDNKLKPLMAP